LYLLENTFFVTVLIKYNVDSFVAEMNVWNAQLYRWSNLLIWRSKIFASF